jgi:hypothetical protein
VNTPRVKISHEYGEMYSNIHSDLAWAGQHRETLLEQFGVCVALVYQQHIVGTGETIEAAVEDAENRLPAETSQITPAVFLIAPRNRLHRVKRASEA